MNPRYEYFHDRLTTFQMEPAVKNKLNKLANKRKVSVSSLIRDAINTKINGETKMTNVKTPAVTGLTWKNFVVTCCRLGIENTSQEIADAISRNEGVVVTKGQVAAVKANYTMKKYDN